MSLWGCGVEGHASEYRPLSAEHDGQNRMTPSCRDAKADRKARISSRYQARPSPPVTDYLGVLLIFGVGLMWLVILP